jgi:hypothetical protein
LISQDQNIEQCSDRTTCCATRTDRQEEIYLRIVSENVNFALSPNNVTITGIDKPVPDSDPPESIDVRIEPHQAVQDGNDLHKGWSDAN